MASFLTSQNNDLEANDKSFFNGCPPSSSPVYAPTTVAINEKETGSSASIYRVPIEPAVAAAQPVGNEIARGSSSAIRGQSSSKVVEEPPSSMRYYAGDVVLHKENPTSHGSQTWMPQFGTVLKGAVGSEMHKSQDNGASSVFHVHWDTSNRISSTKASSVALVDRVLLRGQRVENANGDVGTVVDYNITATVIINGTNIVIEKVPLARLSPITPFVRGQEVLFHRWVGVITSIKKNVWFRMDGGLTFYMEVLESDGFTRVDPYWGLGVACPGMRIRLPLNAFKKANWVSKSVRFFSRWLPLQYYFSWHNSTIIKTEVIELEIKWIQKAPGAPETLQRPCTTVPRTELKDLLVIGTPSTETIGINSVRKLQVLPEDEVTKFEPWLEKFRKSFVSESLKLDNQVIRLSADVDLKALQMKNQDCELPVKVLLRHNTVTVEWDRGIKEHIPAIKIPKVALSVDDGEFPMGLTVASVEKSFLSGDKYGIVMASSELAKSRSRKVNVRWITDGVDSGIEEVPVFDIRPHHTYSLYHRGTIVFPRSGLSTPPPFAAAVVVDLNVNGGSMIVKRSFDNSQHEVYPHQVGALEKRCHWSFFTRSWILDDLIPPPYQLEMEFSPMKRLVDVSEQKWDLLDYEVDPNNPTQQQQSSENDMTTPIATVWDEAAYELLAFAPETHRYYNCSKGHLFGKGFAQNIEKEMEILKEKGNVPEGIWLRCYENRLDLISVMMVGPTKTPYEDGLFLFDIQLPTNFPQSLPAVHYVSYTNELHPLLSFDGNVCVSSLQWSVNETEKSHIALFVGKLQALIFTPTPYFSHPSKRSEEDSEHGQLKAQMYNQNVFVRVLDTLWNMLQNPHSPWEKPIRNHFASTMPEKFFGIEKWINGGAVAVVNNSNSSAVAVASTCEDDVPSYPFFPLSDGIQMSVKKRIERYKRLTNQLSTVIDTTADSESHEVKNLNESTAGPAAVSVNSTRMLTPIAEITEPSSTSTFGTKVSNITVTSDTEDNNAPPSHHADPSLDSLKNVKPHGKNKAGEHLDEETAAVVGNSEQMNKEDNSNNAPRPAIAD